MGHAASGAGRKNDGKNTWECDRTSSNYRPDRISAIHFGPPRACLGIRHGDIPPGVRSEPKVAVSRDLL